MTINTKALYNQLKANPEFISEVCENMSDAICKLVTLADQEPDGENKRELISFASKLATDRLDIKNMIR